MSDIARTTDVYLTSFELDQKVEFATFLKESVSNAVIKAASIHKPEGDGYSIKLMVATYFFPHFKEFRVDYTPKKDDETGYAFDVTVHFKPPSADKFTSWDFNFTFDIVED